MDEGADGGLETPSVQFSLADLEGLLGKTVPRDKEGLNEIFALVKGLQPTDEALKSWINLQEKLDQTYGRKRKRASIRFYPADLIQSPLSYTVANPDIISYPPLESEKKQSLRQIVSTHPKGSE